MLVRAKHQIAYKGQYYERPMTFDMDPIDFPRYQYDVEIATQDSFVAKAKDKLIRKTKTK